MTSERDIADKAEILKLMEVYEELLSSTEDATENYSRELHECQTLLRTVCERILDDETVGSVEESTLTALLELLGHVATSDVLQGLSDADDSESTQLPIEAWLFGRLLPMFSIELGVRSNKLVQEVLGKLLAMVKASSGDIQMYCDMAGVVIDLCIDVCDLLQLGEIEGWLADPLVAMDTEMPWPVKLTKTFAGVADGKTPSQVNITLSDRDAVPHLLSGCSRVLEHLFATSSLYTADTIPWLLSRLVYTVETQSPSGPPVQYLPDVVQLVTCLVRVCGWPEHLQVAPDTYLYALLQLTTSDACLQLRHTDPIFSHTLAVAVAQSIDAIATAQPTEGVALLAHGSFSTLLTQSLDLPVPYVVKRAVCRLAACTVQHSLTMCTMTNIGTSRFGTAPLLGPLLLPRISNPRISGEIAFVLRESVFAEGWHHIQDSPGVPDSTDVDEGNDAGSAPVNPRKRKVECIDPVEDRENARDNTHALVMAGSGADKQEPNSSTSIPMSSAAQGLTLRLLLSRLAFIRSGARDSLNEIKNMPAPNDESFMTDSSNDHNAHERTRADHVDQCGVWLTSLMGLAKALAHIQPPTTTRGDIPTYTEGLSLKGQVSGPITDILDAAALCLASVVLFGTSKQIRRALGRTVAIVCANAPLCSPDNEAQRDAMGGLLWAFCLTLSQNVNVRDVLPTVAALTHNWLRRTLGQDTDMSDEINNAMSGGAADTNYVALACACLKGIAVLPIEPGLRKTVICSILTQPSVDPALVRTAVWGVPFLFIEFRGASVGRKASRSGPSNIQEISQAMSDLFRTNLSEFGEEIVQSIGVLSCVLSGSARLQPSLHTDMHVSWPIIKCSLCDHKGHTARETRNNGLIAPEHVMAFTHLLETCLVATTEIPEGDSNVVTSLALSLRRAYHHLSAPVGETAVSTVKSANDRSMPPADVSALLRFLLMHPSLAVRIAISVSFSALLTLTSRSQTAPSTSNAVISEPDYRQQRKQQELVINALKQCMRMCKDDPRTLETLLLTCGQLGRTSEHEAFLEVILVSLMPYVASTSLRLRAVAWAEMAGSARCRGISATDLLMPNFGSIASALLKLHNTAPSCAYDLTQALDVRGPDAILSFNQTLLPYLLPECIRLCSLDSLRWTAGLVGRVNDIPDLLIESTHHIFAHLFTKGLHLRDELKRSIQFVLTASEITALNDLLSANLAGLLSQLVMASADSPKRNADAIRALKYTAREVAAHQHEDDGSAIGVDTQPTPTPAAEISDEQLSVFLQQHLLAILTWLNGQLLSGAVVSRTRTMTAFARLLALIDGKYLYMVRGKVLGLLRLGLSSDVLVVSTLEAWRVFLRKLSFEQVHVILNESVFMLVSVLEDHEDSVAELLNLLIYDDDNTSEPGTQPNPSPHVHAHTTDTDTNQHEGQSPKNVTIDTRERAAHSRDALYVQLYILPQHPALERCRGVVERAIARLSFEDFLVQLTIGLESNGRASRIAALSRLRSELRSHQEYIHRMAMHTHTDLIDPRLRNTMSSLIRLARTRDRAIRVLVGECLGALGAIDPGRMQLTPGAIACNGTSSAETRPVNSPADGVTVALSVSTHDPVQFALQLLELTLVPNFLTATDTKAQDRAAFAIQEILKYCKFQRSINRENPLDPSQPPDTVSQNTQGTRRSVQPIELWGSLSAETREIVHPYVESQYRLRGFKYSARPATSFLLASTSYAMWVSRWCIHLISIVSESKRSKLTDVFLSCRGVVQDHLDTALLMLPPLILNILCFGSVEAQQGVVAELKAVMVHAASGDGDLTVGNMAQLAAQTVFGIMGQLQRWVRTESEGAPNDRSKTPSRSKGHCSNRNAMSDKREEVLKTLSTISQLTMAHAAFKCGAYGRALMHFEAHMRALHGLDFTEQRMRRHAHVLQENIAFLQSIYARLELSEGMAGVAAIREKTSLSEETLDHESAGRWTSALTCHTQALITENDSLTHTLGLLKCHINLSHYDTVLVHIGATAKTRVDAQWRSALQPNQIEAALRLGDWDSLSLAVNDSICLDETTSQIPSLSLGGSSYESCLANILLNMKQHNQRILSVGTTAAVNVKSVGSALISNSGVAHTRKLFQKARGLLMVPLAAATMESDTTGSYQRAYPYLLALHTLHDVEVAFLKQQSAQTHTSAPSITPDAINQWEARLELLQESDNAREPVLNMRRLLLGMEEELWHYDQKDYFTNLRAAMDLKALYWLKSARLARLSGRHQTAYRALLQAGNNKKPPPKYHIEKAKVFLSQGREHAALSELKAFFDPNATGVHTEAHGKAGLLLGQVMKRNGVAHSNNIILVFKQVAHLRPDWEKAYYVLGAYYEEFRSLTEGSTETVDMMIRSADISRSIIQNYGHSLRHGTQYIYRTMPMLLTVWLDYSMPDFTSMNLKAEVRRSCRAKLERALTQRNTLVTKLIDDLPAYHFYTAFSQILSRICHSTDSIFAVLEQMILKVLREYTHQGLWAVMNVDASIVPRRQERCKAILHLLSRKDKDISALVKNYRLLRDSLIDVCDKNVPTGSSTVVNIDHFNLRRKAPFQAVVPLSSTLTARLPNVRHARSDPTRPHSPFPASVPTIYNFGDKVEVLQSLQKPKKLTLLGSDGQSYLFLCKPNDDLRTDSRVMEFYSMINKLLRRDAVARHQNLCIRTYAVVVLNHRSGMLEWVHHTEGFRHTYRKILATMGRRISMSDLKRPYDKLTKEEKRDPKVMVPIFVNQMLPMWPAVFYKWFLNRFPEPTSWVAAKTAYARSTAVMSIVGYIMGLGDRHGENILFDSKSGEIVHVDFNCMFNAGKLFEIPERVPFRLTHNMIDAFGLTGYEGLFRASCERTLSVMRKEIDTLMSVLTPFIHDPVADSTFKSKTNTIKTVNEVRTRLNGSSHSGLPMSVEGEVTYLIGEATSVDNLSRMYVGWGPYL